MMDPVQIDRVAKILSDWNPLGDKAGTVQDLNGYRTEAIDIISVSGLPMLGDSVESAVRTVLNQAFDLSLSVEDCAESATKIASILNAAT